MKIDTDATNPRYVFVDGLRGLAAVGVLCCHLLQCSVLGPTLEKVLPAPILFLCCYGSHGVQVFFVISGFVIAHSLRNVEPTGRAIGNFILRRQLRLDLPYWAALALVLASTAVEAVTPGLTPRTLPGAGNVIVNLLYLQNVVGATQIVGVAWTLCLEVQFYLVFILILAFSRRVAGQVTMGRVPLSAVALVGGLGLLSLLDQSAGVVAAPWFIPFWFYFAAGVLCYWHLRGRLHPAVFWSFMGAFVAIPVRTDWVSIATGFTTALVFFAVGRAGKLTTWLGGPVWKYLGKTSYSFYLVHLPVLSIILRAGYKISGENQAAALGWFVAAAIASLGAGHLMWKYVETPSLRLSARLKLRQPPAQVAVHSLDSTAILEA